MLRGAQLQRHGQDRAKEKSERVARKRELRQAVALPVQIIGHRTPDPRPFRTATRKSELKLRHLQRRMRLAPNVPCGRVFRWTSELLACPTASGLRGPPPASSTSQQRSLSPSLPGFPFASPSLLSHLRLRSEQRRVPLVNPVAAEGKGTPRPPAPPASVAMECRVPALQTELLALRSPWLAPRWDAARLHFASKPAARGGGAVLASPQASCKGFGSAAGATKPRPQGQAQPKGRPDQRPAADGAEPKRAPRTAKPAAPAKKRTAKKAPSKPAAAQGAHANTARPAAKPGAGAGAGAGAKARGSAEAKPLFRALPLAAAAATEPPNAQLVDMAEHAPLDRTTAEELNGSTEISADVARSELGGGAVLTRGPPPQGGAAPVEEEEDDGEEEDEEGEDATAIDMPLYRIPEGILPEVANNSKIKSAEFLKSSADVSQCPTDNMPEIAVIGRSNVGKSSLINMLTHKRGLAQTSKKPGKTQLINHFLINGNWYLVDLPGYGYAVAPKAVRSEWNTFTKKYFLSRPNLTSILLLVDASIPPLQVDLDCVDWLGQNKIPVTIVFTKCDRRKKKKNGGRRPAENVAEFEARLAEYYEEPPPWIMTSSVSTLGKDTLLAHIAQIIHHWKS